MQPNPSKNAHSCLPDMQRCPFLVTFNLSHRSIYRALLLHEVGTWEVPALDKNARISQSSVNAYLFACFLHGLWSIWSIWSISFLTRRTLPFRTSFPVHPLPCSYTVMSTMVMMFALRTLGGTSFIACTLPYFLDNPIRLGATSSIYSIQYISASLQTKHDISPAN